MPTHRTASAEMRVIFPCPLSLATTGPYRFAYVSLNRLRGFAIVKLPSGYAETPASGYLACGDGVFAGPIGTSPMLIALVSAPASRTQPQEYSA
jgi:hypothetical protein